MSASKQDAVDWPESIYYVCNSGSGIVVNATPLVQAGTDRIAGMRVLCGVRNPKKPTSAERRESIRPAERLTAFARGIGIETIDEPMHADPDSYVAWSGLLDDLAKRARELEATLVYNVTGGPRTVPLAALLGASSRSRSSSVAIAVSFSDRTCRRLDFDSNGVLTAEHNLRSHARMGFDDLIPLYGYREQDPASRRQHEEFIRKHREVAERVLEETKRGGKQAVAALHWSMQFDSGGRERDDSAAPFCVEFKDIRANRYALDRVVNAFGGLDGLEIVRGRGRDRGIERINVKTEQSHRFVGGVWLEAVVFGLVCDVFRKTRGAEVIAGATLAVDSTQPVSSNVPPDDKEIDVAVVVDDQLHVIEAKAVTNSGRFGEHINKVASFRQELGSQLMRAFLVAPLLVESDLENKRVNFIKRADKQGVRLYCGLPRDKHVPRGGHPRRSGHLPREKQEQGALDRLQRELKGLAKASESA